VSTSPGHALAAAIHVALPLTIIQQQLRSRDVRVMGFPASVAKGRLPASLIYHGLPLRLRTDISHCAMSKREKRPAMIVQET
jgi:hypothetical protein